MRDQPDLIMYDTTLAVAAVEVAAVEDQPPSMQQYRLPLTPPPLPLTPSLSHSLPPCSSHQVVSLTVCICAATWVLCYVGLLWSASLTPVMPVMSRGQLAAIASLGATLMMARSPASAVRVCVCRCVQMCARM